MPVYPRHTRVALVYEISYLVPGPLCWSLNLNSPSKERKGWYGDMSSSPAVNLRGAERRNKKF